MAWINGNWEQDDTKNYGYPFRWYSGLISDYDASHASTVWKLHRSVNYGYPYILKVLPTPEPPNSHLVEFGLSGIGRNFKAEATSYNVEYAHRIDATYRAAETVQILFHVERL